MLSGKYDANDARCDHCGRGWHRAADWAMMLFDMYSSTPSHGYKFEVLSAVPGDQAGCRNVTAPHLRAFAYGYLRAEAGVHRLVRISPSMPRRRHTSFASVDVMPDLGEDADVEIDQRT